jgi:hypothetical protein
VDNMRSGNFSLEEIRQLDSQRQTTHYELCRITGKSHFEAQVRLIEAIEKARFLGLDNDALRAAFEAALQAER